MASKTETLMQFVAPVVESLELQLWGLEYITQGRHSVVRIYIDAEQGVGVSDCAKVSRQVSSVFDVEDPITGEYTLEVSSPGMDRPLFNLEQFAQYKGHQVKLRLRIPFEGRRKFSGILNGVEENDVIMVVDEHEYLLPIDTIEKANVIPQFKN